MSEQEHAAIMVMLKGIASDVEETRDRVREQNGRVRTCENRIAALNLAVFGVGAAGGTAILGLLLRHMGLF